MTDAPAIDERNGCISPGEVPVGYLRRLLDQAKIEDCIYMAPGADAAIVQALRDLRTSE